MIGVPDEIWGERPKAFVVLAGGRHVNPADLIGHVAARLAKFKAPDSIDFVAGPPSTPTGKIRKQQLRDVEQALTQAKVDNGRVPGAGGGPDDVVLSGPAIHAESPVTERERKNTP